MTDTSIDQQAEALLREAASLLTDPRDRECLLCYVVRMLDDFGCSGRLRWATWYRDQRAPRATALESRLLHIAGICDCRILLIGYRLTVPSCYAEAPEEPGTRPACRGGQARLDAALRAVVAGSAVVTLVLRLGVGLRPGARAGRQSSSRARIALISRLARS